MNTSKQLRENKMTNWDNNKIQYPRLLAEIVATQNLDMQALADSMDLSYNEIDVLFERAILDWNIIKAI